MSDVRPSSMSTPASLFPDRSADPMLSFSGHGPVRKMVIRGDPMGSWMDVDRLLKGHGHDVEVPGGGYEVLSTTRNRTSRAGRSDGKCPAVTYR